MDYIWNLIILFIMIYFLRLQVRNEYEMESIRTFQLNGELYIRAGLTRRMLSNGIDFIPLLFFYSIIGNLGFAPHFKLLSIFGFAISYYIFFISIFTQTPGDMILKIKTISLTTNQRLTIKQIVKRIFFHIVLFPTLILKIPFFRSQKKPFLADKLSQSEVVQVKSGLGEKWINR
ncbi:RDD family protein [Rossellomorea aquimaris]|uniref:RDD family protein n=1 Tax=Rossellomorea aquimaris TaxID=189382 RepID=UPI0007D0757F|nr:RDD family protein [Rossellomorea aquimaris]